MNNIKWVWLIFVRADIVFYTFCTRNIHLIITKVGHLQCISRFWTSTMFPLYISNTWSYCSHSDRNFPEAQTEHKQTRHVEEKKHRKTMRKGRNSSVVHLADDILCTLSVISFSSATMDRISPLSFSGMTASVKSLETPFSSVSLASPLSLPLSGCYFPVTLWISYNPFFLSHLFSYFLISAWTTNSTPASRQTVRLSVHLSVSLPPFFTPVFTMPVWPKSSLGKIQDEIGRKKKLYRYIF